MAALDALPGQKLRLRDILERHSLPTDLTVIEGFDGPTQEESLLAGTRIRIHFVVQEDVFTATKESDGRDLRIPMNSSVLFEPLPTNRTLDDVKYRTARDVAAAKPHPGPVYATVALLLPDGTQIDEDDLIEFADTVEKDEHGSEYVSATRHYFSHATQCKALESYRIPADLEANFTTTVPPSERYLACELLHTKTFPLRARMHLRRRAALGALKHAPEPPVPLLVRRITKRYYALASDIVTNRVFALEVYDDSPVRFLEKDPGRKSDEDIYFLLYGLVNFEAVPKIGPPEADQIAYRDLLPLVKVPLDAKKSSKMISINAGALNYQLIKASDYERVGLFFRPLGSGERKPLPMSEAGPKTMDLAETRFYDAFTDSVNGSCYVKMRSSKGNLNLERLVLELGVNLTRSRLSESSLVRMQQLEDIGKPAEAPAPPVPRRDPTPKEDHSVKRNLSINLPGQKSRNTVMTKMALKFKQGVKSLTRRSSEDKLPGSSSGRKERRPAPLPPDASPLSGSPKSGSPKGGSPLTPLRLPPRPGLPSPPLPPRGSQRSGDAGYVRMMHDMACGEELRTLEKELKAEEKRRKDLQAQLENVEKESQRIKVSSRVYDDDHPVECIASFTKEEVLKFLRGLGLGLEKCQDKFREYDIEGYWLVECSKEALRDIGMKGTDVVRFYMALKGQFPANKTLSQIMAEGNNLS